MQANQQEQIILHDLIKGQSVYNNVIFKPANLRALCFDLHQPLTNLAFHNCIFDRVRFANDTLDNCLFDHCEFIYAYICENNKYLNNTSFNCCVFRFGRIHRNEDDLNNPTLFYNCDFSDVGLFYHYKDEDND